MQYTYFTFSCNPLRPYQSKDRLASFTILLPEVKCKCDCLWEKILNAWHPLIVVHTNESFALTANGCIDTLIIMATVPMPLVM